MVHICYIFATAILTVKVVAENIPTIKSVEIKNIPQDIDRDDIFDRGKLSYHIFHIRSGFSYNLSCSKGITDSNTPVWTYENGNPVEELDFDGSHLKVFRHELIFVKISPTMSGDYYCFQRDTQRIKYKLRVYTLAQLGANFSFSFLTTRCSSIQIGNALLTIKSTICGKIDACPYRFDIDCDIRNISAFLSIKNKQRVVTAKVVAMKFTNIGRREGCDIKCNLQEKNYQLMQNLPQLDKLHSILSESYTTIEGRYLKKHDVIKNREPKFICKPGQVIRSEMTCVPCEAGYYSPSFGPESTCLPCPLDTYQSRIGGWSCYRCSNTSITMTTATNSSRGCLEKKFIHQAMLVNESIKKVQRGDTYYDKQFVILAVLTSFATLASLSMWTVLIGQLVYEYVWDMKKIRKKEPKLSNQCQEE